MGDGRLGPACPPKVNRGVIIQYPFLGHGVGWRSDSGDKAATNLTLWRDNCVRGKGTKSIKPAEFFISRKPAA